MFNLLALAWLLLGLCDLLSLLVGLLALLGFFDLLGLLDRDEDDDEEEDPKSCFKIVQNRICCSLDSLS